LKQVSIGYVSKLGSFVLNRYRFGNILSECTLYNGNAVIITLNLLTQKTCRDEEACKHITDRYSSIQHFIGFWSLLLR